MERSDYESILAVQKQIDVLLAIAREYKFPAPALKYMTETHGKITKALQARLLPDSASRA